MSDEQTGTGTDGDIHVPVTYESCAHIAGPFFHGTKSVLEIGDELVPGKRSNFQAGRLSNNIYFAALADTAARTSPTSDSPGTPRSPTAPATPCASSVRWTGGKGMTRRL